MDKDTLKDFFRSYYKKEVEKQGKK